MQVRSRAAVIVGMSAASVFILAAWYGARWQVSAQRSAHYRLAEFCTYLDGGSLAGILVGADGDTIKFCVNRRALMEPPTPEALACVRRVYVGLLYPPGPDAPFVAVGSAEEAHLISALQSALDFAIPPAKQDEIARALEGENEATLPAFEKARALVPLQMDEFRALRLLWFLESRSAAGVGASGGEDGPSNKPLQQTAPRPPTPGD